MKTIILGKNGLKVSADLQRIDVAVSKIQIQGHRYTEQAQKMINN